MYEVAINTMAFEFTCSTEPVAKEMQKEIANYTLPALHTIIAKVVSAETSENVPLQINRIEVDLGEVNVDDFGKYAMLEKFTVALSEEIQKIKNKSSNAFYTSTNHNAASSQNLENEREIMEDFLLRGDVPWWMDKNSVISIDEILQKLLKKNPDVIKNFLEKNAGNNRVSKRIAFYCKPSTQVIINKIAPATINDFPGKILFEDYDLSFPVQSFTEESDTTRKPQNKRQKLATSRLIKHTFINKLLKVSHKNIAGQIALLQIFSEQELGRIHSFFNRKNEDSIETKKLVKLLQKLSIVQVKYLLYVNTNHLNEIEKYVADKRNSVIHPILPAAPENILADESLSLPANNENRREIENERFLNTDKIAEYKKEMNGIFLQDRHVVDLIKNKPAIKDQLVIEDQPAIKNQSEINDQLVIENQSAIKNKLSIKDQSAINDQSAKKNQSEINDQPTIKDQTAINDKTAINEKLTINDQPAIKDQTAINEKLTINNQPEIKDQLAINNQPEIKDQLAIKDQPVIKNQSVINNQLAIKDQPSTRDIQSKDGLVLKNLEEEMYSVKREIEENIVENIPSTKSDFNKNKVDESRARNEESIVNKIDKISNDKRNLTLIKDESASKEINAENLEKINSLENNISDNEGILQNSFSINKVEDPFNDLAMDFNKPNIILESEKDAKNTDNNALLLSQQKNSESHLTINFTEKNPTLFQENSKPFEEIENNEDKESFSAEKNESFKNKQIRFLMKSLESENADLFSWLYQIPDKDLMAISTIFKRHTKKRLSTHKIVDTISSHPYFLNYNLLNILAFFSIDKTAFKESLTGLDTTTTPVSKNKISTIKSFIKKVQLSKQLFFSAIENLSEKDAFIINDIFKKRNYSTLNERKIMSRFLYSLPEENIALLTFFTSLPEEELQQITASANKNIFSEKIQKPENYDKKVQRKVYISNGGLCLISVYFTGLFTKLNYLEKGVFKNKYFAARALYLTEYLVKGKQKNAEYLLQLNKILCGFDMDEMIPGGIRLTKKEMAEADTLLAAVIENWRALKNTTLQGFQESFLFRKAIVTENDSYWILQVERKGFDLLLNTIPWSYHMIKFPWMKKMIKTEW